MASQFLTMMSRLRESRRIAKMTRAELEAMKLVKFRKLVRHAQAHSPYYAQIIQERGINLDTCVPQDFPVLTKTVLMQNFDRIVTDRSITKAVVDEFLTRSTNPNDQLFDKYRVIHTSGSSGEVGYFLYSDAEWVLGMSQGWGQRRGQSRRPARRRRFGRFRMAWYAATGGHFAGVTMMSAMVQGIRRLFVKLKLLEINSPLPQVIEQLNEFQPEVVAGYTTGLKILAEQQNAGVLRIAPVAVTTGGETMTPADKALLESAFHCPATNGYGTSEHLMQGGANPDGETMTLYDSDLIYEIFDDHTLVTNLFNFTEPLIRYRMSDILRPVEQKHPSSPFLVINSLLGRTEKIPKFVNRNGAEDFIHPISVVELFIPGVTRFQMRLIDRSSFRFAVVVDPSLDVAGKTEALAAAQHRLREFLDQKDMQNVTFDVLPVDDIPVDPKTGKFKLIVDDPGQSLAA